MYVYTFEMQILKIRQVLISNLEKVKDWKHPSEALEEIYLSLYLLVEV